MLLGHEKRRAGLTRTTLQFEDTPPSQPLSQNISRTTTPRGSADSSRQGSRHTSAERPALEATPTVQTKNTHMLQEKITTFANPMERSASLQDVASTSYATIAGSHHKEFTRDPRLRARAQVTTESRGPFDKAHRSPVKIPEAPKAFCRPPKRRQESDEEGTTTGRATRQKTEVGERVRVEKKTARHSVVEIRRKLTSHLVASYAFRFTFLPFADSFSRTTYEGKNKLICDMYTDVKSFEMKLKLFIKHIDEKKLDHFPNCKKAVEEAGDNFVWQNITMRNVITQLQTEFVNRFTDFKKSSLNMEIFQNPFAIDISEVPSNLQMNIVDLQSNSALKTAFKESTDLIQFYGGLSSENFKELKKFAQQIITMFGSTYLCEQTFSILNYRKNKNCSRLTDEHLDAILRVSTTKMKADVKKLASQMQPQKSH
ncbi:hypothetical protein ACJJTC_002360 [Scirpophaga incertulas]